MHLYIIYQKHSLGSYISVARVAYPIEKTAKPESHTDTHIQTFSLNVHEHRNKDLF